MSERGAGFSYANMYEGYKGLSVYFHSRKQFVLKKAVVVPADILTPFYFGEISSVMDLKLIAFLFVLNLNVCVKHLTIMLNFVAIYYIDK